MPYTLEFDASLKKAVKVRELISPAGPKYD